LYSQQISPKARYESVIKRLASRQRCDAITEAVAEAPQICSRNDLMMKRIIFSFQGSMHLPLPAMPAKYWPVGFTG